MDSTLCIDLDEVVWDWLRPFVSFAREKLLSEGISIPNDLRAWTTWNGYQNYGISREKFNSLYREFCLDGRFADLPYIKGAKKILNQIGKEARIIFVTMRPPSTLYDTLKCFILNEITEWHSLIHVASGLQGKHGDEEVSLQYIKGVGTQEVPQFRSKLDVYKHYKPNVVFDDKPEYIEQAIEAGVPHAVIVARLHNIRWRKDNLKWDYAIKGGAPLSFAIKNTTVYIMYPDWYMIKTLMELTNYGQVNYWSKWKEGVGEGHGLSVSPK